MPRRNPPPKYPQLWDLAPARKLPNLDKPGLMPHLRGQIELPPTPPDLSAPTPEARIRWIIYDPRARPANDNDCYAVNSRVEAERVISQASRGNRYDGEPAYAYELQIRWGIPPTPDRYRLAFVGGPWHGAYVRGNLDDGPVLSFLSLRDAEYWIEQYSNGNRMEVVAID